MPDQQTNFPEEESLKSILSAGLTVQIANNGSDDKTDVGVIVYFDDGTSEYVYFGSIPLGKPIRSKTCGNGKSYITKASLICRLSGQLRVAARSNGWDCSEPQKKLSQSFFWIFANPIEEVIAT